MPNVAQVLKEEIQRVARKEVRVQLASHEADRKKLKVSISDLKKRMALLERENRKLSRAQTKAVVNESAGRDGADGGRFWVSGKGIRSMRKKLGLTQAELARLLGVSGQAVYQWERRDGSIKVRSKTREAIIKARKLGGAREAQAALASI